MPKPERFEKSLGKDLTPREIEVLRLAADGMTQADVAAKLEISPRTVEHLLGKAMKRLKAKNITQAVAQALRYRVIS